MKHKNSKTIRLPKQHLSGFSKVITAALIALSLVSCGGGGSTSDNSPSTAALFSPSLSSEAAALPISSTITRIESPMETGTLDRPVQVIDNGNANENIIFATDAAGEIIFIGSDLDNRPLGIETTAKYVAVIGLFMSDNPAGLPLDSVRPMLEATVAWPSLVSTVRSELAKGIPVSQSNIIGLRASEVIIQAQEMYARTNALAVAGKQSDIRTSGSATAADINIASLDYYLFNTDAAEQFWISNGDDRSVRLNNRTFLQWSAESRDLTNDSSLTSGRVAIPPMSVTVAQFAGDYTDSESRTSVSTAPRTQLKIGQNLESINANAVALVTRSTFAIIESLTIALGVNRTAQEACVDGLSRSLLNKSSFAAFVANTTVENFESYLTSFGVNDLRPVAACAAYIVPNASWVSTLNQVLKSITAPLRIPGAIRSGVSALGTLAQLVKYSDRQGANEFSFELCRYSGSINPCVRTLTGPAAPIRIVVGQIATVQISAQTDLGTPIVVTPSLDLRSSNTAIVTVDPINTAGTITIRGVAVGSASVFVSDPVSGVELPEPVQIIVEGEFDFEVVESVPPLLSRLSDCQDFSDPNSGSSGTACLSEVDARIRCVGSGCLNNRFFVALKRNRKIDRYADINACEPVVRSSGGIQEDFGIVPGSGDEYVVNSRNWFLLPQDAWVKPFNSESALSPIPNGNAIYLNLTGAYTQSCLSVFSSLEMLLNIYDSQTMKYIEVPFTLSVP